jgi:crotonobetainyl-CoA:carnitine CoA-transferase CaiB-like acyl-CoA transferase
MTARIGCCHHHACNRGKRCIEADFETPEGRALIERLAMNADVVIENFKVGLGQIWPRPREPRA